MTFIWYLSMGMKVEYQTRFKKQDNVSILYISLCIKWHLCAQNVHNRICNIMQWHYIVAETQLLTA